MTCADFYEIAAYGNENWRGKFTPEEVACNAYDYLCEFERSKQDGQETEAIKTLIILLVSDGSNQCFEWVKNMREEIKEEGIMYDFTKSEMEIVKDNLMSFIANFDKPRIKRGDDGKSFYVFTDDSDSWRQYCYNIDYLNGWLYGCVQAACGNPTRDEETREMCNRAGFRERYAILYGEREVKNISGHKCYIFTYSEGDEYQDANGATYDTVTKNWIG